MSDVREVEDAVRGRYEVPLLVGLGSVTVEEPGVYRVGVLGRWRDRFVESMSSRLQREADRELGLVPEEGSVLGDAKRGVMAAAGWIDEVHRVELTTPGQSSPVLDGLRAEYRIDPPVSSFEDALARVTAAFVEQEEAVLAHAAAAALRARGWTVASPDHLHMWGQGPGDVIRNQWTCSCGSVKYDERMPG